MMLPPPSRLFDYVVVVALRPDRRDPTSTPIVKPHLLYRFPPLQRDAAGTSSSQPAGASAATAGEPAGRGLRPTPQRGLPPTPTAAAGAAAGLDARQLRERQKAAEEERKLYKAVKKFCFPDLPPALSLASFMNTSFATSYGHQQQGETFSFTLTESNGAKRWGYCLRAPGPSQAAPFPQCICIISFLPCFSIFSTILQELTSLQKADAGFEAFTQFLNAVYKEPLPIPGGTLRLTLPLTLFPAQAAEPNHGKPGTQPATRAQQSGQTKQVNGDVVEYAFTRPDDSESLLDHVNFEPLLHFLDAPNIASILASLLMERRMIFIATNLNTLSSCVQAAASILYPFNWQHIFIPVVPQSLLSFCCAPMPFLVGILRVHLAELKKLSDAMEEVVVVDVDNNKVLYPEDMDDVELVPPVLLDPLLQSLQRICKEVRGVEPGSQSSFSILGSLMGNKTKAKERKPLSKALVKDLQNVFIAFMVDLLATYKDFMRKTPVKPVVTTAAFNPAENGFNSKYFDSEGHAPLSHSRFLPLQFLGRSWLIVVPADMRALLELVTQAQLFVTFIEERHKRFVNSGKFERRLTTRLSQVLLPGSKEAEQLKMALLGGKLEEPPPSAESSPAAPAAENRLKTRTRFTMYDTGAITRDEVTKSLWEEEKRREGEQKRLEEEEEKKRKKSSLPSTGGSGSGIGGGGSGSGSGGGGGHSETTTSGGGGGMSSIWNRLFSAPGNREDESQGFHISDPSNFRKLDTDLAEYAMATPGAGTTATVSTPPAAAVGGDAGSTAAATEPTKPAPGFGRGITVGAGGWMKKNGISVAQHSSGALSAPAVQTAGPSLGGARAPKAAAAVTPVHPYTASSIPSPPTSSGAPNVGQARSREPSGDGQDLFLGGDDVGDESEASSSKIVHEGGLVKLAGQQYYIQLSDKWQLRWFILTETHLSYYRPKDKRKPCGVVPLKKVADISFYVTHPTLKRNNLIELKTKILGGEGGGTTPRTYYMEAPSKDDGLRWLNAFQQVRLDSQIVNASS